MLKVMDAGFAALFAALCIANLAMARYQIAVTMLALASAHARLALLMRQVRL